MGKNTKLLPFNKQQYVGYKNKGDKRYQLVLAPRISFFQVSFSSSRLSGKVQFETEPDALFPYALRVAIDTKESLIQLLEDIFPHNTRTENNG